MIPEKKCAVCGKVFCPTYYHAFKIEHGRGHFTWFCKYTCMLRWREEKEKIKKYKKRGLDGS